MGAFSLKYGVWFYGFINFALCIYFISVPELTTQDWIAFVGICCPATAMLILQLYKSTEFAYAWANWYFSFLALVLGTVYIFMQTMMLRQMKNSIGSGEIRFRINQAGNPLSPQLVSDNHMSLADSEWVHKALLGMPQRYYDVQSLYHNGETEFQWNNGEATLTTSAAVLNLFLWLDWFGYLFFAYLVVI